MNKTEQISENMFIAIMEEGRRLKSSFIVYDPLSSYRLYGFNGEGYENRETRLGCMKYSTNSIFNNAIVNSTIHCKYGFACYTKDLYAASKLLDSNTYNNKIVLEINEITESVQEVICIDVFVNEELVAKIPTFKFNKFRHIHLNLLCNLNLIDEIDITEDDEMVMLLGKKASEGASHLLYNHIPMYLTANLLNVNKGDRIIASHTDEENPRVLIQVIKKKYTINTIFKILSL
jgi:hypothetical protein